MPTDFFLDRNELCNFKGKLKTRGGKIKDGFDSISKRMEEQMKIVFASSCTRCMFLSICYGGCRLERTTGEHDNGYSKNDLTYI